MAGATPPTRRRRRSVRASGRSTPAQPSTTPSSRRAVQRGRCGTRTARSTTTHTGVRLSTASPIGLPGVIADRYGDVIVLQVPVGGRRALARRARRSARRSATGVRCVFERSDADVRALEGLPTRGGVRCSARCRPHRPSARTASPTASTRRADRRPGSTSTSATTARLVRDVARGRRVLNAFCYTGGFTLAALAGGAAQRPVDRQLGRRAGARAREPRAEPGARRVAQRHGSKPTSFADLRRLRNEGAAFDLIVLDPPKFAPTAAHAERAARAYKDINLLALKTAGARRPAGDVLVLGRHRRRPVPEDRRRRRARRRQRTRRSCAGWARAPIIRSRSAFPKATT